MSAVYRVCGNIYYKNIFSEISALDAAVALNESKVNDILTCARAVDANLAKENAYKASITSLFSEGKVIRKAYNKDIPRDDMIAAGLFSPYQPILQADKWNTDSFWHEWIAAGGNREKCSDGNTGSCLASNMFARACCGCGKSPAVKCSRSSSLECGPDTFIRCNDELSTNMFQSSIDKYNRESDMRIVGFESSERTKLSISLARVPNKSVSEDPGCCKTVLSDQNSSFARLFYTLSGDFDSACSRKKNWL